MLFRSVINLAHDVLLDGFTISGGDATIYSNEVLYQGCQIKNYNGGGVLNTASSKLVLKNSIVKANRALDGAGIFNETGSYSEFVNILICGNHSEVHGGGMYNLMSNTVLKNVTISGNRTDGLYCKVCTLRIVNTIIAGNITDIAHFDGNCSIDYGHCLIQDKFYGNDSIPTKLSGLTPRATFMEWVDPTGLTSFGNYRLKDGSYAIDYGNNYYVDEAADLNGNPRIMGGTVDLGAFEFSYMTVIDVTVNGLPVGNDLNDLNILLYKTDGTRVNKEIINNQIIGILEPGEYVVSVSYPGCIMSYNNNEKHAPTWKDATPVRVEQVNDVDQIILVTVTLIPEQIIESGAITISGTLSELIDEDDLIKARPIVNVNGNVNLSKSTISKSDGWVLIKTIQTTDGHFSFGNLSEGDYRITADIPGFNPGTFEFHAINENRTINFFVNQTDKTITPESEPDPGTVTELPLWQAANLKVYPNPMTDQLYVSGLEGIYTVKIINILGQLVYSATGSSTELSLNIGHLPSGMYFLRIESKLKTTTRKIIKQ